MYTPITQKNPKEYIYDNMRHKCIWNDLSNKSKKLILKKYKEINEAIVNDSKNRERDLTIEQWTYVDIFGWDNLNNTRIEDLL